MTILRAKTEGLFAYEGLTDRQQDNIRINQTEMHRGDVVLNSAPQRLVLELTNACNLSCIMCGRHAKQFKPTFFPLKWLERLSDVLDRATEVTLFGWGEPTVHPQFRQIIEYFDSYPLKKYFLTNGMLLNRFIDIVLERVDVMAVSLDGAEAKTNDAIRQGADFRQITSNLARLVQQRQTRRSRGPHINLVMTLMKDNLKELPRMVERAADLGIEEVKAVYLTAFSPALEGQILFGCRETVAEVFDQATETADRLGILIKLPYLQGDDPAGDGLHKPCYVGWRDLFLGSDGYLRPCQSTSQKLFSIHQHESIAAMWNAAEYRNFRAAVNRLATMPEQCRVCYQSSHANWNHRRAFLQSGVSSEFAPQWEKERRSPKPFKGRMP